MSQRKMSDNSNKKKYSETDFDYLPKGFQKITYQLVTVGGLPPEIAEKYAMSGWTLEQFTKKIKISEKDFKDQQLDYFVSLSQGCGSWAQDYETERKKLQEKTDRHYAESLSTLDGINNDEQIAHQLEDS